MTKTNKILQLKALAISTLVLMTGILHAQNKLPQGFVMNAQNRVVAPDSIVPEYLFHYGSAGLLRSGMNVKPEMYAELGYFLEIPVLLGKGITRDRSLAEFKRAIQFNLTGRDPEGSYSNPDGKGNIILPVWVREYLSQDNGYEKLYDLQWRLGNILMVEAESMFPLKVSIPERMERYEMDQYRTALVYWAAAYPWNFYQLPNVALKEALVNRNNNLLELFAARRFVLDEDALGVFRAANILPAVSQ